jgi:hypothetical protein
VPFVVSMQFREEVLQTCQSFFLNMLFLASLHIISVPNEVIVTIACNKNDLSDRFEAFLLFQ